ncbi:Uncharacterised protein [Serratia fonticola]|uniref:Uncharacterized protein n=1 Tax=Serratia fonticola TaxID=47917 RepID=A0A4U9TFA6_SERFO|nr:Uncharacterised protein [Serratia fonticola]
MIFIEKKLPQLIDIIELQRQCGRLSQQGLAILQSELMCHLDNLPTERL